MTIWKMLGWVLWSGIKFFRWAFIAALAIGGTQLGLEYWKLQQEQESKINVPIEECPANASLNARGANKVMSGTVCGYSVEVAAAQGSKGEPIATCVMNRTGSNTITSATTTKEDLVPILQASVRTVMVNNDADELRKWAVRVGAWEYEELNITNVDVVLSKTSSHVVRVSGYTTGGKIKRCLPKQRSDMTCLGHCCAVKHKWDGYEDIEWVEQ